MTVERRKHPRLQLEVDVDVSTPSNFYVGRTRDISLGGLFIEMPLAPEPGTELTLKLALGKRNFQVSARSTWVLTGAGGGPVGFGVEFVDLAPGVKRAVEAFMDKRDPLAFDLLDDVEDDPDAGGGPPPLPGAGGPPPLPR